MQRKQTKLNFIISDLINTYSMGRNNFLAHSTQLCIYHNECHYALSFTGTKAIVQVFMRKSNYVCFVTKFFTKNFIAFPVEINSRHTYVQPSFFSIGLSTFEQSQCEQFFFRCLGKVLYRSRHLWAIKHTATIRVRLFRRFHIVSPRSRLIFL